MDHFFSLPACDSGIPFLRPSAFICDPLLAFVNLNSSAMMICDAPAPPLLSYTMDLKKKETSAWRDTTLRQRAAAEVCSAAASGKNPF
jgi:hypothetical protein